MHYNMELRDLRDGLLLNPLEKEKTEGTTADYMA